VNQKVTSSILKFDFLMRMRNRHFLVFDIVVLLVVPVIAMWIRMDDFDWIANYGHVVLAFILVSLVVKLTVFFISGLYRRYWQYASVEEISLILLSITVATFVLNIMFWWIIPWLDLFKKELPKSMVVVDWFLTVGFVAGIRLAARVYYSERRKRERSGPKHKVLIIGAGNSGSMLVREIKLNPNLGVEPVGFIDDDPRKQNYIIHGLPVLGTRTDIPRIAQQLNANQLIIAMPSAPGSVIREIVSIADRSGLKTKTVPAISEILDGRVTVKQLREVNIEDLLRREPVRTDINAVRSLLRGKVILVTGAGGSIGSEICRQIAQCQPDRLLLMGHGENSIHSVSDELSYKFPFLRVERIIADIRDERRLARLFDAWLPDVVFHSAAHKHVPLMEENIEEAFTNNVLGTIKLMKVAEKAGTDYFVLISTDKAVNPISIMGVTKRLAEIALQMAAWKNQRRWVAVRFGNVLGSRGSVVPKFQAQIQRGGPVRVTHPDMRRFFMTIPEAVQLVLQSITLGRCGEIFVLDMGEQIRVVDLARDLVALSGMEVGKDVEIVYSGIRPGEKLEEELISSEETCEPTLHEKILLVKNGKLDDYTKITGIDDLDGFQSRIEDILNTSTLYEMKRRLQELTPDFKSDAKC